VREALKRLAEDRLVVLVPRSGCYICELTEKDVTEIFEIRKRLEGLALEYAFETFDLEEVRNLRQKFAECLNLGGKKLVQEELKLDSKFHSMIFEKSGSPCLQDLLSKILARIKIFRTRGTYVIEKAKGALETHLDILDSILKGDRDRALEVLNEHIDISKANAIETLHFLMEAQSEQ